MIYIGIDPGTNTGFAAWDSEEKRFLEIKTLMIHQAIQLVKDYAYVNQNRKPIKVVFEDARQRTWFGERSFSKLQGAGSVKRDCSIWEEFLKDYKIEYWAKPPIKGMTKISDERFRTISGWRSRTSNHARDAAMLVIGR